jgi:hypothetical protein
MNQKPKPCPCCACRIVTRYAETSDFYSVLEVTGLTCDACGLRTLPYSDPAKALAIWNRREKRRRKVIDATKSEGGHEL